MQLCVWLRRRFPVGRHHLSPSMPIQSQSCASESREGDNWEFAPFTNHSGCFTLHHQYRNSVASRTLSPLFFPVWRRTWTAYSMVRMTYRIPNHLSISYRTLSYFSMRFGVSLHFLPQWSQSTGISTTNGWEWRRQSILPRHSQLPYSSSLPYPSSIQELSTLCPSASCMISCLSKSLNAACPPAGDDIIVSTLSLSSIRDPSFHSGSPSPSLPCVCRDARDERGHEEHRIQGIR